jgi:hypothetical protein
MKKTITREVDFCDKCEREECYLTRCLRCGMEVCYQCVDKVGVKYEHGVYVSGSGDGFYCRPCDIALYESNDDALHLAYRAVLTLRNEVTAFGKDFKRRQEVAEAHVDLLARQAGVR